MPVCCLCMISWVTKHQNVAGMGIKDTVLALISFAELFQCRLLEWPYSSVGIMELT